ncbi:MAG: hypothetical protein ACF8Q5_06020 [Phycisphaerales bacterium JB040]
MGELHSTLRKTILGDDQASMEAMPMPRMLDLRPARGAWMALPYQSLRGVEYIPDRNPSMTIEFSSHVIEVTGRNLQSVYTAVVGHRASVLAEVSELYIEEEGAVFIERLVIRRKRAPGEERETGAGRR